MPARGSTRASHLVVVALLVSRLLEHLEVHVLGMILTRLFDSGAPLFPRALEYLELAVRGSSRARPYGPVAPVKARPQEDF